jgi:hypothetical protein
MARPAPQPLPLIERVQHQIGVLEQANAVADELVDEWAERAKGSGGIAPAAVELGKEALPTLSR